MNDENSKQSETKNKPSRRKLVILVSAIVLFNFACMVYIYFIRENSKPDPACEKAIRLIVAKQLTEDPNNPIDPNDLTDEDFAQITQLEIYSRDIIQINNTDVSRYTYEYVAFKDIKFLEKFTNLAHLSFINIQCTETKLPKWIELCAKLGVIDSDNRTGIDLKPLKKLVNLQTLRISSTPVKNLKQLSKLKSLERIIISNMNESILKQLKGFDNLKFLTLYIMRLTDLKPVKDIKNLEQLSLLGCDYTNNIGYQTEDLKKALPKLKLKVVDD